MPNRNADMISRIAATTVHYPFSFTVLGDSGAAPNPDGDLVFQGMLGQMSMLNPPPVFFASLGDFAGPGSMDRHERYLRLLDEVGFDIPNVCCIGNHECDDPSGLSNFESVHGPVNYFFDYGNTRFVAINSVRSFTDQTHTEGPGEDDLAFLDASLAGDMHLVRVVMMHLPPLFGDHYSSTVRWGFDRFEREFLGLIRKCRVRLVLCAHIIDYDRYEHDGATYVVSGCGGWDTNHHPNHLDPTGPPYRGHFFHFVELTVYESGEMAGRVIPAGAGARDDPAYRFSVGGGR